MKTIIDFASQCGVKLSLDTELIINRIGRYYLVSTNLRKYTKKGFYYSGKYLGKVKRGKFFPSFNLLTILSKGEANSIIVGKRAAWLFICGRDVFRKAIIATRGSRKKGDFTLILNKFGECLGFGRILCNLDRPSKQNDVAVSNISDIGDFLRRETR